jgi:hypothetical protein
MTAKDLGRGRPSPRRLPLAMAVAGLALVSVPSGLAQGAYDYVTVAPGIRQLFLDDFMLGGLYRVRRHVHQPAKKGAVLRADRPWETAVRRGSTLPCAIVEFYTAPVWDPDEAVFKMWYIIGDGVAAGFARSRDGMTWEKPILGKREQGGSKANNLVTVAGNPRAAIVHVLRDPDAPPDRRYKGLAWLGAAGRQVIASADGYEFRPLDVPPIPGQDTSHLIYDEVGKRYVLTVKHPGPFGRSVYLSTSPDFEHWTPHELIFHADALDQELGRRRIESLLADPRMYHPVSRPAEYRTEVYMMAVFPYESLYVGLPVFFESSARIGPPFNNQDGINSIKLAASRDLRTWVKVGNRESFIPVSPRGNGAIDTGQVLPASRPVVRDDELWFYYSGIDVRYPPNGDFHGAIHLATLRRDGFVSPDGAGDGAYVETRAIRLEGTRLYCNVDAGRGEVTAELLGRDLPEGVAGRRSRPVRGDRLRAELVWDGAPPLAALGGRTVRVRFHLREAALYSFWVEP